MPRRAKPPRLYLRTRAGRPPVWVIRDRSAEIVTGAGRDDRRTAETALAAYLDDKYSPDFGQGHPTQVMIADVLDLYGTERAPKTRRHDLIGGAIKKLLAFFGSDTVSTVTAGRCGTYVDWRTAQTDARAKKNGRQVKASTARRELVVLGAALTWCHKAGKIDRPIPLTLPPQAEPRESYLTRSQAAVLLAGALGWDTSGKRNKAKINRHLARFILLGIYTGTRHDAILKLQWMPNTNGGWVDFDAELIYRRPQGVVESAKRKPPVPIPPRLLPHLRRWRKLTARYVIEWAGLPIVSQERRAWRGARQMAKLGADVTPHILRHTCATWMLQAGVSTWDVARVLGTTENVIRHTYGHHADQQARDAVAVFSSPQNGPRYRRTKIEDRLRKASNDD